MYINYLNNYEEPQWRQLILALNIEPGTSEMRITYANCFKSKATETASSEVVFTATLVMREPFGA
jgi:hypothetical protein